MQNKYLLTAVNAKYIHSNLALRYIRAYSKGKISNINLLEFSINDSFNAILSKIFRSKCSVIAFSCYIWNMELVLKLCSSIKKVMPESIIILGGPEVTYDPEAIMSSNSSIDYIILGEGELTFMELAHYLNGVFDDIKAIAGIAYRTPSGISSNEPRDLIDSLDTIPFPYEDSDFCELENKIIYYETSRGCPFSCQYCLSSTIHGVRFFSLERIKRDIACLVSKGLKQVKLVDRTFNCNKRHCMEIMDYIIALKPNTNFHFEIAADLIDEDFLELLEKAPDGLFQFEIGVQSTNTATLSEIKRKMDFEKVKANVQKLIKLGNSHIHLDLIAGLPYEDLESFMQSFDAVYELGADMLQLGFLKLLKGSGIRNKAAIYEVLYNEHSPYEVLSTKWMSYEDLLLLKDIEQLVEIYNNSGRYKYTLAYALKQHHRSPYQFFHELALYYRSMDYYLSPKSSSDNYSWLIDYYKSTYDYDPRFNETIKLDWILGAGGSHFPEEIQRCSQVEQKAQIHAYIKESNLLKGLIADEGDVQGKDALKQISYEIFSMDVLNSYADVKTIMFFTRSKQKDKISYISLPVEEIIKNR